jgi:hypothetical protein
VPQKYIRCFSFGEKLTSANNFCIGRSIDVIFCFTTPWLAIGGMADFFGLFLLPLSMGFSQIIIVPMASFRL